MPQPVADDDHKRRARRRLIGAVALTILAIIILPLVLEDKPPPAGPLQVHMPAPAQPATNLPQNAVVYAPPPANTVVAPSDPGNVEPTVVEAPQKAAQPVKKSEPPPPAPAKPAGQQAKPVNTSQSAVVYTVQVGVFADKANVQKLQAQISALGLKPYSDALDGSTRVRIGTFKERSGADATLAKLSAAGIKGQVVEK